MCTVINRLKYNLPHEKHCDKEVIDMSCCGHKGHEHDQNNHHDQTDEHHHLPEEIKKEDPLEILKNRYASGEINEEEYRKMKQILLEE